MKTSITTICLAAAALAASGCTAGLIPIANINADPGHFVHREVHVQGRVTKVIGAFSTGVYEVEDGSGKIVVLSSHGIPQKGLGVRVDGHVAQGVNIMGHEFGTTIQETRHRIHY